MYNRNGVPFIEGEEMKQTLIEQIESGKYDRIVLNEIANGRTYAEISRKTGLKKHNITNCINHLYRKFNVKTRPQLACKAYLEGYID